MMRKFKRYNLGGSTNQQLNGISGILSQGADAVLPGAGSLLAVGTQLSSSLVDLIDKPDEYGMQSRWGSIIKGGAKAGLIGAGIAAINYNKDKAAAMELKSQSERNYRNQMEQQLQARLAADPTLLTGDKNAQYFAAGGQMKGVGFIPAKGKSIPLSSTSAKFQGPSHAEGGIKMPQYNAEVEGNETMTKSGYVFSDRLTDPVSKMTFAKQHEKIGKMIGKVEMKTLSPERVKTLEYLYHRENELKLTQDYIREHLGLNI